MSTLMGQRVDEGPTSVTYQVVGTRNELNVITMELEAQFGVMDIIRTGAIVLERSSSARFPTTRFSQPEA